MRSLLAATFWRFYAKWYDHLWDMQLTADVADAVVHHIPPDLPVVEVGAGTGLITRRLALDRHVERASEPAPAMRRRLIERQLRIDEVGAEAISELRLPVRTRCLVAINVLHLVPLPGDALAQLLVMAGTGGRVVVVTPAANATLLAVIRAARARGAGWGWSIAFLAAHLLLAPLAAIANVPRGAHPFGGASPTQTVGGVQEIFVFQPTSSRQFGH
jgi:SAM-dependent methyltransferase